MNAQYRHSQPGYLMIVVGMIILVVTAFVYVYDSQQAGWILGTIGLFILVFGYKLTVEISDGCFRFWFGPGIFWKKIAFDRIAYCEPCKGIILGWGIHFGPGGWLYNVSGMKAVTVVLKSGKKLHIGTNEPVRLIEAINSSLQGVDVNNVSGMWVEIKTDYLGRVEQALSAVRHPRSFEILADVGGHLDRRFTELEPQQQTWENFQKIVTEMGPPSEYAELVSEDKKSGRLKLTKYELGIIGILLVIFGASAYSYPQMPEKMATHWNLQGQVNGYMSKPIGMFGIPVILSVFVITLIVIPRTASVSVNIEGFKRFYGGLVILMSVIMSMAQCQVILWNLGIKVNPNVVVAITASAIVVWMLFWYYRSHRLR
jgi:hypothetical protein